MVSVWHQSTARAIRKHGIRPLSFRSRGTLMSYTDHSVQRRLKSNAPCVTSWSKNYFFYVIHAAKSKLPVHHKKHY